MIATLAKNVTKAVQVNGAARMSTISGIKAREIIDSRGNPTVEVDVTTNDGMFRASVPSGASTGIYEAAELRDGGSRYLGKGVLNAVNNANTKLAAGVVGQDPTQQEAIDNIMFEIDGTENKGNIGANAILGVSLAVAKAGAAAKRVPLYQHFADLGGNDKLVLPVPSFNVINGGSHAGNKLAFQEFMILPTGASSFSESMQEYSTPHYLWKRTAIPSPSSNPKLLHFFLEPLLPFSSRDSEMGCEVYHTLKKVIKSKYGQDATNVGDEGGFAPNIQNNVEGVELLMEAIEQAGHSGKVKIGMDVASSEFLVGPNQYDLDFKTPNNDKSQVISGPELGNLYKELMRDFPIVSIEDPFDQDDWENYTKFQAEVGDRCQIVGDDLLVTNPKKIVEASAKKACNALLLKVNQIGSVTESIQAVKMSKQNGWGVMASHRSGETEDYYIADLAVGLCTGQIKTGAPCRSERLAKLNQLLRIEEELGSAAVYAGETFRSPAWMA